MLPAPDRREQQHPVGIKHINQRRIEVERDHGAEIEVVHPGQLGHQFADVPGTKSTDQVTQLEEEKIMAYYGAGTLYAEPSRVDPLV